MKYYKRLIRNMSTQRKANRFFAGWNACLSAIAASGIKLTPEQLKQIEKKRVAINNQWEANKSLGRVVG